MFLGEGVLKICSKGTGEHPCQSVISTKLLCNFIEIGLQHGCFPENLLHIFRTPFLKNTPGSLLLNYEPLIGCVNNNITKSSQNCVFKIVVFKIASVVFPCEFR